MYAVESCLFYLLEDVTSLSLLILTLVLYDGYLCIFRIICDILSEIEKGIQESSLLKNFNMKVLPALHAKVIELAELLVIVSSTNGYNIYVDKCI